MVLQESWRKGTDNLPRVRDSFSDDAAAGAGAARRPLSIQLLEGLLAAPHPTPSSKLVLRLLLSLDQRFSEMSP